MKRILFLLFVLLTLAKSYQTENTENEYVYTYKTVCKSSLNFEFEFNNYLFTNKTNFNYIERNNNIVFDFENVFKNTNKSIEIVIIKNLKLDKQTISFLFTGYKYSTKNILRVNILLDKCSNFRDIIQYSYNNDYSKTKTQNLYTHDGSNYELELPSFEKYSKQTYKFYLVNNGNAELNFFIAMLCNIVFILFYAFL